MHIFIFKLVQEAQEGLGKVERTDLSQALGVQTTALALKKAVPTLTLSRKAGPSDRLRSWVLTAAMTLLLPWTSRELRARSPSLCSRPSGANLKAFSTIAWSSEFRFRTSNTERDRVLDKGKESLRVLSLCPYPHPHTHPQD